MELKTENGKCYSGVNIYMQQVYSIGAIEDGNYHLELYYGRNGDYKIYVDRDDEGDMKWFGRSYHKKSVISQNISISIFFSSNYIAFWDAERLIIAHK